MKIRIPQLWQTVLKTFQLDYPNAIIAGGAVRDLYLGKPVRDVDIFLNAQANEEALKQFCIRHYLGKPEEMLHDGSVQFTSYYLDHEGTRFELCPGTNNMNDPINAVFSQFDFGICQIAWDGEDLHTTKEFHNDVEDKTLTRLRPSIKEDHTRRLREKFPDYQYVNPQLGLDTEREDLGGNFDTNQWFSTLTICSRSTI